MTMYLSADMETARELDRVDMACAGFHPIGVDLAFSELDALYDSLRAWRLRCLSDGGAWTHERHMNVLQQRRNHCAVLMLAAIDWHCHNIAAAIHREMGDDQREAA